MPILATTYQLILMQNYWQMIATPTTSDPVGTYTYTITIDPDNTDMLKQMKTNNVLTGSFEVVEIQSNLFYNCRV